VNKKLMFARLMIVFISGLLAIHAQSQSISASVAKNESDDAQIRVRLFDANHATEEEMIALEQLQGPRPSNNNPVDVHRVILRAPTLVMPFIGMADALRHETELDPVIRELAIATSLLALKSRYEFVAHCGWVKSLGIPESKLRTLADEKISNVWAKDERDIIQFAREVTRQVGVSDNTWQAVHQRLGDRQTIELLMNIGFYNLTARFTGPVRLENQPGAAYEQVCVETFDRMQ
jgi:alkylhydroperoxidase family enzyme